MYQARIITFPIYWPLTLPALIPDCLFDFVPDFAQKTPEQACKIPAQLQAHNEPLNRARTFCFMGWEKKGRIWLGKELELPNDASYHFHFLSPVIEIVSIVSPIFWMIPKWELTKTGEALKRDELRHKVLLRALHAEYGFNFFCVFYTLRSYFFGNKRNGATGSPSISVVNCSQSPRQNLDMELSFQPWGILEKFCSCIKKGSNYKLVDDFPERVTKWSVSPFKLV